MPPSGEGARGRSAHDEHVARCVLHDSRADRAEEPPLSAVEAAGAHDDHVRILLLGLVDDNRSGVALALDDLGGHAFLGERFFASASS